MTLVVQLRYQIAVDPVQFVIGLFVPPGCALSHLVGGIALARISFLRLGIARYRNYKQHC